MSHSLSWSVQAQVSDGPAISTSGNMSVDAYDALDATVPAGGGVTVAVQPGDGCQALIITASSYESLTYEVDGSGVSVTLDGIHALIGSGAASLLGATQNSIAFTNSGAEDIDVSILVGRNATS